MNQYQILGVPVPVMGDYLGLQHGCILHPKEIMRWDHYFVAYHLNYTVTEEILRFTNKLLYHIKENINTLQLSWFTIWHLRIKQSSLDVIWIKFLKALRSHNKIQHNQTGTKWQTEMSNVFSSKTNIDLHSIRFYSLRANWQELKYGSGNDLGAKRWQSIISIDDDLNIWHHIESMSSIASQTITNMNSMSEFINVLPSIC